MSRRVPVEGSQPSITANSIISISPTQNVGSEKPKDRRRHDPLRNCPVLGVEPGIETRAGSRGVIAIRSETKRQLHRGRHVLQDQLQAAGLLAKDEGAFRNPR